MQAREVRKKIQNWFFAYGAETAEVHGFNNGYVKYIYLLE